MWASYSVAVNVLLEGVSSVKILIDHITSIDIQLPSIRIYPLGSDTLSTGS